MTERAIAQGSFWAVVQNALRLFTGLVSVPLTLTYLGSERYGLWMTGLSLLAFLHFVDLGLTPALLNRMAEAHGRGDGGAFRRAASASMAAGAALILAGALAALVCLHLPWARWLRIRDPLAVREAPALFAVILMTGALGSALNGSESIFSARMQVVRPRVYACAAALISFGLLLLGVRFRVALPLLAAATGCTLALSRLPLLARLLATEPGLLAPRPEELRRLLREIMPVSLLFLGIQAAQIVAGAVPNLALARARTLDDVASFSVGFRVVNIPLAMVAATLPVVWPAFSVAWARGERDWVRQKLAFVLRATAGVFLLFAVVATAFAPQAIRWWTAGEANVPVTVMAALATWALLQALAHWLSTFLHSISDLRFELFCSAATAALTIALAALWTPRFGAEGLTLGMIAALAAGSLVPMGLRARARLAPAPSIL